MRDVLRFVLFAMLLFGFGIVCGVVVLCLMFYLDFHVGPILAATVILMYAVFGYVLCRKY